MNYQHIYHAGNFADVLKHVILVKILSYLSSDRKSFFVLDTHAGRGRYNLKSIESTKSGEYQHGISRLYSCKYDHMPEYIQHYIRCIRQENFDNNLIYYPGSPALIKQFIRTQDRATFCELNDKEFFKLHGLFRDISNIKLINGDGYEALISVIPPREKRGLVLIDPPFEQKEEIFTLEKAIILSLERWSSGIFMLWYPIKQDNVFYEHLERLKKSGVHHEVFELSLPVAFQTSDTGLNKTAIVVFNPPQSLIDKKQELNNLGSFFYQNENNKKNFSCEKDHIEYSDARHYPIK